LRQEFQPKKNTHVFFFSCLDPCSKGETIHELLECLSNILDTITREVPCLKDAQLFSAKVCYLKVFSLFFFSFLKTSKIFSQFCFKNINMLSIFVLLAAEYVVTKFVNFKINKHKTIHTFHLPEIFVNIISIFFFNEGNYEGARSKLEKLSDTWKTHILQAQISLQEEDYQKCKIHLESAAGHNFQVKNESDYILTQVNIYLKKNCFFIVGFLSAIQKRCSL
jgi:cytochrome c oxidase subunit IV